MLGLTGLVIGALRYAETGQAARARDAAHPAAPLQEAESLIDCLTRIVDEAASEDKAAQCRANLAAGIEPGFTKVEPPNRGRRCRPRQVIDDADGPPRWEQERD